MRIVTTYNVALSNNAGKMIMHQAPSNNSGMSSFRKIKEGKKIDVIIKQFDESFGRLIMPNVIKIDVEGAEQLVLEGMNDILDIYHPDIIMEVTDQFLLELGFSAKSLCFFLIDKGYSMYQMTGESYKKIVHVDEISKHQFNAYFTVNQNFEG